MDAVVLQLLLFSVCFSYADASCVEYYRTSTETCDGWFGWWGCKTVYSQSSRCCSGWRSSSTSRFSLFRCNLPLCNRGYGSDTCNRINEGEVKYKDGKVVRNSGGTCYAPSRCRNCNEGYFPVTYSNGYCKACFKPPNCNKAVCSTWSDYRCDYCVEEYIRTKPGFNVYTGKPDNRQCQKACSWTHGARCFPGTCTGDMVLSKDCQCAVGFNGTNCATATSAKKPTIKDFFLTLVDSSNHKFIVDKALNKTKFWTKETVWAKLKLKASSHYKLEMDSAKRPNYITHYLIGIQDMDIGLKLLRGTEVAEMSMDGRCTHFAENCDKEIPHKDLKSITSWQRIFKGNFMHGDRIKYIVSAKNGGKVFYQDRSNFNGSYTEKQYFLNGIVTTEFLELEFDIYPPVHCFEQSEDCKKDALTAPDFLTQPKLTVQWDGWSDSNSGIEEYVFYICKLKKTTDTGPLTNGKMLSPRNASYSYSSLTLDLEEPGPYSIKIITYDRARNHKVARRIVLFDNASVVDLHGNQSRVITGHKQEIDLSYTVDTIVVGDIREDYCKHLMIDLSPPVIQNLWLTKGDLVNISVHSVLELQELTIEWETFDYHSGIHEVSWKIFDNFTKNVVVHGNSNEPPQGETKDLKECNQKYGLYPRGPNCYCSPYNGCFHRHYQIKPSVSNVSNGGLHFGKEIGDHDYDYYIEVTVVNSAGLSTTKHKKITIDTSPPHEGKVHDGIPGDPEVDFQQSLNLEGHWDDFFDKESGVWLYSYGFGENCLDEIDLNIHSKLIVSEVILHDAVTASGLIKSDVTDTVYILNRNRELEEVSNPSKVCRDQATTVQESVIKLYPHKRHSYETVDVVELNNECNELHGVHSDLISYITSDSKIDISWNVTPGASNVHDYEVGIASENSKFPDVMDFTSSHHHQHIRIFHPGIFDGEQFYVMIKAITKSSVTDIKIIGPFVYDSSKPDFTGEISLFVEHTKTDTYLVAKWDKNAFTDHGDPNALQYEAAIGTKKNGKDVLPFGRISTGGSCISLTSPTCTAFSTHLLPWHLNGEIDYFVTIKVRDTTGHFVTACSKPYRHNIELASRGIVHDIDETITQFVDIDDIDFQTSTSKLTARWSGFEHPHEDINFTVCISNTTFKDFMTCAFVGSGNKHTFHGLKLKPYQTYFQTVIAETEAGNITAVSDGVTVVEEGGEIKGIKVFDGARCNDSLVGDLNLTTSHHDEDKRLLCTEDRDFQTSTNVLQAHWTIPTGKEHFLHDIHWAIEERAPIANIWKLHSDYEPLRTSTSYMEESGLSLSPGRTYRISLKFCAKQYCFKPVHSNGVTVVPNPPVTGNVSVTYTLNSTLIDVSMEPFRDSDMEDLTQSKSVMDHYEWTFADESVLGRLLTKWTRLFIDFTIDLKEEITFTKCWTLIVRGYTKAGLSATKSSEIKDCKDLQQVRPSVVIDASGEPLTTEDKHLGKEIFLDENDVWKQSDRDYTPYSNMLSAVWPTFRHSEYTWAVLLVKVDDPTVFYDRSNKLNLNDPCKHPDAIKCGQTEHEFVNVEFSPRELAHGRRYIICIHSNASKIEHEFWDQELQEIDECSNGITVDLTPPVAADVWIGNEKDDLFQTSTSELSVHWNSFIDVEEEGYAAHISGVTHYKVALGTTSGGIDIKPFTDVGLTNHKTFHDLKLQNGHIYFATVMAYDFTGQFSSSKSEGIKVDTTPPQLKNATITLPSRHISDTEFIEACWTDVFVDMESGISHYSWAVGTHAGYDDIFPFDDTEEECAKTPENTPLTLKEGHAYFVTVKAHNKAGLYAVTSSWAFTVEATPPVPGKVYDGPPGKDGTCIDVDYIENHSTLKAHWKGFHDPHSTMVEYFVNIGSCKDCEDVLVKQSVGIKTDVEFTFLQLSEGLHYYVTVTACNTGGLCSSATSDGFVVDSTPPIRGILTDGPLETELQYQASRNYIGCEWDSFTDPQSDISHYVWRVGTTKGGDNILPAEDVHRHEEAFIFDLQSEYKKTLPKGVRIYCTVRAYNRAGMYVEATSNGFIVDDSPPVFTTNLTMSPIGTIKTGTSVSRTTLRVYWEVKDDQSFIETQHLSIASHMGGDFNLSSTKIEGIVRDYTFTDLDFHDGSFYCIKLISCNGANLCLTSMLANILVDSTRPTPGTFAINTDHAAALDRQPEDWMEWTTIFINLAWLGFEDLHSDIHSYNVNFGSQFMDNDLNEVPHTPMIVNHDVNATFHEDGKVQTFKFHTQKLRENMTVYISVTANNHVGLSSEIVHSQFNLLFGGIMELVRRCDSFSCEGHCVCAPHGKLCHSNKHCNDVSGSRNNNTLIEVEDYLDLRFPDNYPHLFHSPFNSILGSKWRISHLMGNRPLWYEWSVGESDHDTPLGVFDVVKEKVWHEIGQNKDIVFTVDRGRPVLFESTSYSVFVRVWYSSDTYAIFKSAGVTIFHTPPLSIVIKGRAVKEITQQSNKDVDFVTRNTQFRADWTGKFGGEISKYHLYISCHPGGHDLHEVTKNLQPPLTSYNITGLKYEENTKYYTIVQAFNLAGLHTTEVSDGFMLDLEPPSPGIVMDGLVLLDKHATSDVNRVQSFWHGFSDSESGIKNYEYCISSGDLPGDCDIKPLSPIGIATDLEFHPDIPLEHGGTVRGEVRARDVIGHVSGLVSSNGIIIDTTAPVRAKRIQCQPNSLSDASFENIANYEDNTTICDNITESQWDLSQDTCVTLEKSNMAQHGSIKLHLQGSILQKLNTKMHGKYRLIFHTSTIPSKVLHLSAVEGYVQVNDQRHVFMMYSKPNTDTYAWQKHIFYFHLDTNTSIVEFGTVKSHAAFAIDGIEFQLCEVSANETDEADGHVNIHTVFVHDWSSIHAEWSFIDPETDILEYMWAIGTVKGGTQLQTFKSVGRRTFASNNTLRLEHDTVVYVTVIAINAAGLRTRSYSDPIMIDLTKPECKFVNDGPVQGQDFDFMRGLKLDFHWEMSDPESGLKTCYWALGTSAGDTSIEDFVTVKPDQRNASKTFLGLPKERVYVTIRCTNGAGLTHTCSSDGVKLVQKPPSVDNVILELLTTSATQYEPRDHYHGNNTEIRFRWTGFKTDDGVQSYLIALEGDKLSTSEIVGSLSSDYSYGSFTGLNMMDGKYTVSVTGINEVKMYSQKTSDNFDLVTVPPSITGSPIKTNWVKATSTATASWENVFASNDPLYYEVSARLSEGGEGDLVQWQETVDTKIEIVLDTKEMASAGVTVRFSVTAISHVGLFTIAHGDLFVLP
ncbi:uncharacterized protein LOC132734491 [Ruditapes philippinarum]|uniref:uncharacterized protein LOC132734491 n=1 Tax=Ruditapes philippinarum TaxID=129788 RepID=UPI00295A7B53|nr:uncharacterized protein LOC132734491 [Ruditapes philippinarum]